MHALQGIVVRGKGEARTIGYPTANIEYDLRTPRAFEAYVEAPSAGVWTCTIEVDGRSLNGLAVIGMWTQANGLPSLEVYILDFDQDLYGKNISVSLKTKLHEIIRFPDVADLIRLIEQDVVAARKELQTL